MAYSLKIKNGTLKKKSEGIFLYLFLFLQVFYQYFEFYT